MLFTKKTLKGWWRIDGWVLKSTCGSYTAPEFGSQHLHGRSLHPHAHSTHMVYMHVCRPTLINIKQKRSPSLKKDNAFRGQKKTRK